MEYTKEQVIEKIREQHQRDLDSLIEFLEKVWPEDKKSDSWYERRFMNNNIKYLVIFETLNDTVANSINGKVIASFESLSEAYAFSIKQKLKLNGNYIIVKIIEPKVVEE